MTQPSGPLPHGAGRYAGTLVTATQRQFLEAGLNRGLSGAAIQRALQENGMGMREQALYDVIREIRGIEQGGRSIGNTPKRFAPTESAYVPTNKRASRLQLRLAVPYRTMASFTTTITEFGESRSATFTAVVHHRTLLPVGTLDARLLAQLSAALSAYEIDPRDVSFSDYRGELFDLEQ